MKTYLCSRPRAAEKRRGFTLLEAMFAASIMLAGLIATAGVYSTVSNLFAQQRDMAIAVQIAEAFLEQLSILPQSNPMLTVGASNPTRQFDATGRRTAATGKFQLDWSVEQAVFGDEATISGIKEIVVDVSWNSDRLHKVQFFTFRE